MSLNAENSELKKEEDKFPLRRKIYLIILLTIPFLLAGTFFLLGNGKTMDLIFSIGIVVMLFFLVMTVYFGEGQNKEEQRRIYNEENWKIVSSKTRRFKYYKNQA
jgi:hypothetical protein